jgi:hypothetical protein
VRWFTTAYLFNLYDYNAIVLSFSSLGSLHVMAIDPRKRKEILAPPVRLKNIHYFRLEFVPSVLFTFMTDVCSRARCLLCCCQTSSRSGVPCPRPCTEPMATPSSDPSMNTTKHLNNNSHQKQAQDILILLITLTVGGVNISPTHPQ